MTVREIKPLAMGESGNRRGWSQRPLCKFRVDQLSVEETTLHFPLSSSFTYSFFLSTNVFEPVEGIPCSPQPATH